MQMHSQTRTRDRKRWLAHLHQDPSGRGVNSPGARNARVSAMSLDDGIDLRRWRIPGHGGSSMLTWRERHSRTRVLARSAAALSGVAILLLSGSAAVSARMAPPSGPSSPPTSGQPVPLAQVPSAEQALGQARPDNVVAPAPAGAASADVVKLDPLDTCVSCTRAGAGHEGSKAGAIAVRVLGRTISGGDSSSNGADHGALLAIPANPLLNLAVADWTTRARATGDSSSSASRAALVDLHLGGDQYSHDGVLSVAVLEAISEARWAGPDSHGDGENNGVRLTALDDALVIVLLHSEASSDHAGKTYVVSIDKLELLDSDQVGAQGIPIDVPGVAELTLLHVGAIGGVGNTATVGGVNDLLGSPGQAAGALTASAEGSSGATGAGTTAQPPTTGTAAAAAGAPATTGHGGLSAPLTGAAIGLGGLLLLAAGAATLAGALRRRRA